MNSQFVDVLDILLDCLTSHENLVNVAQSGGPLLKNMGCVRIHLKLKFCLQVLEAIAHCYLMHRNLAMVKVL
jgi:hypothetical protein